MNGWRNGALGAAALATALLAAACTAPPAVPFLPAPAPAPPAPAAAITSFTATPPSPAPALVALAWTVTVPTGAIATCRLDTDGDGADDLSVTPCPAEGARNVTRPTAVTTTARLTLDVGGTVRTATSTVTVTPATIDPSDAFGIRLREQTPLTDGERAAFVAAAARWQRVLARGVADSTITLDAGRCGSPNGALVAEPVDDVLIDVWVGDLDGPGGLLGRAGPCVVGSGDGLTRFGVMQFDRADLAGLATAGMLDEVVVHEMGHVLGFGTRWAAAGLVTGVGGPDPRYVGARGRAAWSALGGTGGVPVEDTGGDGTAGVHWREATFETELMTGWIDPGSDPLSAMSVASLADLGYQVDLTGADAFVLPGAAARAAAAAAEAANPSPAADMAALRPVAVTPTP